MFFTFHRILMALSLLGLTLVAAHGMEDGIWKTTLYLCSGMLTPAMSKILSKASLKDPET